MSSKLEGPTNQGAQARRTAAGNATDAGLALSFIRTMTVGPGIAPGLLTPNQRRAMVWALAALVQSCFHTAITAGGEFRPALRTLVPGTRPDDGDSRHTEGQRCCVG